MTKKKEPDNKLHSRLPVSLTVEDNRILTELRYHLEKRSGERLSWADVVRICIRTQAKAEGIRCK